MADFSPSGVAEFAIALMDRVNPATASYYLADARQHVEWLAAEGVPLDRVTVQVLERYVRYLAAARPRPGGKPSPYASSTVGRKVSALREFYGFLHRCGVVTSNPAAVLRRPKTTPKATGSKVRSDTIRRSLESLETNTARAIRDHAIITLAVLDGLKVAEIGGLSIGDIDLAAGLARVPNRPGRKDCVFLGKPTIEALGRWLAVRRLLHAGVDNAVFISMHWTTGRSRPGSRISKRGLSQVLRAFRRCRPN